jgi:leucyl-tRNA synthetase
VSRRTIVDDHRLAYVSQAPVNWCPGLGTVLANEEITPDGRSERGNFPVFKRNLRQWMMRITDYSDRLADDLDRVQWPEKVKAMQRNWIGRSHGARVAFPIVGAPEGSEPIEVFTTRPDTLFGATFMVLAPEHPLVDLLVPEGEWAPGTNPAWTGGEATPRAAVTAYRRAASRKSDVERQIEGKDKTGVFTGAYATNPATGAELPVFIADYVLMGYGTGAIMAVPGQDERDWHFADVFDLPRIRTVQPSEGHPEDEAFTGEGPAINSANDSIDLNGKPVAQAKAAMIDWLVERGSGEATVSYKLRDWLFSRQRYWGEPFPIVFDAEGSAHAVPESMLPIELPEVPDYSPRTFDPEDAQSSPEPPLGRVEDWVNVELDLGDGRGVQSYRRETNTMPNWAGSCWYYLRYLDPENRDELVSAANEEYWIGPRDTPVDGAPAGTKDPGGVDLYIGGVEHAVLHLLYARFWHKVLFDLGHVSSEEPFRTYYSQGYIQAAAYRDDRGQPVEATEVEEVHGPDGDVAWVWQGKPVTREFGKIGKSLKNMVSPDEMYAAYGADTLRLYEMSLGPLDQSKPWDTRAIVGSQRFLQRLWRNVVDEESGEVQVTDAPMDDATARVLHRTIDAVRRDYDELGFNTAIARLIELNNALTKLDAVPREAAEQLVLMVAPLAPHIAEELWSRLGHPESLTHEDFPVADPALLVEDSVTCVIQIKGKVRDRIEVAADISEDELRERALALPRVAEATAGGVRTVIVRAPKLVNVVPL